MRKRNKSIRPPRSFSTVLGQEIILVSGLVKFVPVVAYHFCLNFLAIFSQLCTSIIPQPSTKMGMQATASFPAAIHRTWEVVND